MSYVYAFLGFIALIVLHEAGHFVAAKAVGMRVERFALFFPPLIAKIRRGETEYAIGALPFGGYVKITGMNPEEEIPPEVVPRAYYNQPPWKRIVVIAAGPAVNIVLAIVLVWVILLTSGELSSSTSTRKIAGVDRSGAAAHVLRPGDEIVTIGGRRESVAGIRRAVERDRCPGAQVDGCVAARALRLGILRDGHRIDVTVRPRRETLEGKASMYFGIVFQGVNHYTHPSFLTAGGDSVSALWSDATSTVSAIGRIFESKERRQLSGVVGTYDYTAQQFKASPVNALDVLALISLSLGVINLFPFLPLDGGLIFWAVAEKLRGKRIPFVVMERAGVIGFVLILALFVIGLSNDIHGLANGTFNAR